MGEEQREKTYRANDREGLKKKHAVKRISALVPCASKVDTEGGEGGKGLEKGASDLEKEKRMISMVENKDGSRGKQRGNDTYQMRKGKNFFFLGGKRY